MFTRLPAYDLKNPRSHNLRKHIPSPTSHSFPVFFPKMEYSFLKKNKNKKTNYILAILDKELQQINISLVSQCSYRYKYLKTKTTKAQDLTINIALAGLEFAVEQTVFTFTGYLPLHSHLSGYKSRCPS